MFSSILGMKQDIMYELYVSRIYKKKVEMVVGRDRVHILSIF